MQINRVEIQNFRSIDDLTVKFLYGCQALIGINESGKSNILRALHLLDPVITASQSDLRIERHDEDQVTNGRVRFVFDLTDQELEEIYGSVSVNFAADSLNSPLVVEGGVSRDLKQWCKSRGQCLYTVKIPQSQRAFTAWSARTTEGLNTNWFRNKTDEQVSLPVAGKTHIVVPARGFVFWNDKSALSETIFERATLKQLVDLSVQESVKAASPKLPKCIFWKYADQYLLPSTIDMASFCASPDSCIPLKSMFELAGYDVNKLAADIETAKAQGHHRYKQILEKTSQAATKHIRSVWKDYKTVSIKLEPSGTNLSPIIVDDVVPLDMANRSDGFKRFVSFLLQVSAKVRTEELQNTLILVDEPEIGLHPTGARSLMRELIEIGKSNFVVYSTHSIFMIDKTEIGRHLVVEKKNEVTSTWRAEKSRIQDEEVLHSAMGYSMFETLKEHNVIFEGWRDKEIFRVVSDSMCKANKPLKDRMAGIGMTFADGVKDVKNVAHFLQLASRPCLIISDADKVALQHRKAYQQPGAWGTWKTLQDVMPTASILTGEDLLIKAAVVKRANKFKTSIENLDALNEDFFNAGEATLAGLRRWVATAGLNGEQLDESMNALKTVIFDGLKRSEISDQAEELIDYVVNYNFAG